MSKRKLYDAFLSVVFKVFGFDHANKFSSYFTHRLAPVYTVKGGEKEYLFYCPNLVTLWRAETFFVKEPETIEWIDGFKENEILFDIGANIGQYAIYAAKKGVKVLAFEPESQNYAILNRNIFLNRCQEKVLALNIALSDKDALDHLYLGRFLAGSAFNSFGKAMNERKEAMDFAFKQGSISFTLDSFLEKYPHYFPHHIKIDVDGIEAEVLKGALGTLADKRLKSLTVELNDQLPEQMALIEYLKSRGLEFKHKKHSDRPRPEKFKDIYNYLFVRK